MTFDPAVASTLIEGTPQGAWLGDGRTFKVEATVADAGVDVDQVKIDITDAYDVAGNLQVDHTATVGLEIDTLNPTASTLSIVVDDNDQTDGDAVSSFTVSTTDVDPGMIHVDMRGSEHTELTSIKSSYIAGVNQAITDLEAAESTAAGYEQALKQERDERDAFFGDGGDGNGFAGSVGIGSEAARVEGLGTDYNDLEGILSDAQSIKAAFFAVDPAGPSAGFENSGAIANEASRLEGLAGELVGDAATQMSQAAAALRGLEGQAKKVEDDVSNAQQDVDTFFTTGRGIEFNNENELTQKASSSLRTLELTAQGLESDVSTAETNLANFLTAVNDDASVNLKDGSDYAGSASIASEIAALETLLNGDDGDNASDRVTSFFDIHSNGRNGTDAAVSMQAAINDLADLNNQIDNSIVIRDIPAVDDTAHTVSLTQAEVDRLGEGSVQIEATQTDAVGNLHEGVAATNSFVIDTIAPDAVQIDVADAVPPLDIVADVDATGLFTVTTKFSEPMDQAVIPSITFDPSVATTLTNRSGGWTNETTFVLTADIDDAGVDANAVTVDVSGAQDIAGNPQNDYSALVEFEVDTENPVSATVVIDVADSDQTDGDAANSYTVKSTDADPGIIHVDMRGSEFTELTGIKSSYITDLNSKVSSLESKFTGAKNREDALENANSANTTFFNNATSQDPSGSGEIYSNSGDIAVEAQRIEEIAGKLSGLESDSAAAAGKEMTSSARMGPVKDFQAVAT